MFWFVSITGANAVDAIWPDDVWPKASPESQGIDSQKFAEALLAIRQTGMNIHSLLVIRHGRMVLDATFYPYDGRVPHELASVTKSVMTSLVAIAADQGKLSLDQPVLSFFPGRRIANRDARKERITVRHLVGMTSGLLCTAEHDEQTLSDMQNSADWVQFVLDRPMAAEPGTRFVYCSPGMHLLSAILQKATGMTTLDFARAYLFEPLGIKQVIWPSDPQGITHGWGDIRLFPEDAARIGYLWLNGGHWRDRQIVSAKWVKESSSVQIRTGQEHGDDYGYGWWIMTGDAIPQYSAIGRGGQRIGVLPSLDIVYVTTGGGFEPGEATDRIGAALIDTAKPIAESPQGVAQLRMALAKIAEPPARSALSALPAMAHAISGKTYVFEPNPYGLGNIRVDFTEGAQEAHVVLVFTNRPTPQEGDIGLDGVYRMSAGRYGFPVGMRGHWSNGNTFLLEYDEIANRDANLVQLQFDNDRMTFRAQERTHSAPVILHAEQR
jgi:CubicO group peptidase (beta-lactamase class C family)